MSSSEQVGHQVLDDVVAKLKTGAVTTTLLRTDSRVLARVTDGIYRSPTSAIRELVANAYDADAKSVIVDMNPPWFDRITVRDDGEGMDAKALVRVIEHIGGSSKRTRDGQAFGTTGEDPLYSLGGRRLIGRIGIGLFAVSQLTRHFQIVTKRRGSDYRLVVDVILGNYNEDDLGEVTEEAQASGLAPERFAGQTRGQVAIQSYATDDIASHGTDITLLDLKPDALDLLSSREDWLNRSDAPFKYHIGLSGPRTELDGAGQQLRNMPYLPWTEAADPLEKFKGLYQAVISESGTQNTKLEVMLDRYLQLVWKLALSVPMDYVDAIHPFDFSADSGPRLFLLSNEGGAAQELDLAQGETIRSRLSFRAPEKGPEKFTVLVDGLELRRPLRFGRPASADKPGERPLMFVGSWTPPLEKYPASTSGGRDLSFEAYFLWLPKMVPREHRGLLVRIADASGMLFDEKFMDYPIAELARLAQTSAEVFVHRGLDAALNIDRESFNFGHPHAKLVRHWVHGAMRQLATTQKRIADGAREGHRQVELAKDIQILNHVVDEKLETLGVVDRPEVHLVDTGKAPGAARQRSLPTLIAERNRGALAFEKAQVFGRVKPAKPGKGAKKESQLRDAQLSAIAALLEAAGAFKDLDFGQQEQVLNGIARIVWGTK